ncbi:hypothetical protein SLS60_008609 [Paraconiothyrium brasiliense]|uniref:Uncharacterized protein n=1 Tax=Paraconiothyrium brasiliense TaxID=300254 RepID=A0ABR3QZ44_9PLEO
MDRVNSTEDANTSQEQLRTQSRAPASADEDRRRMPPPPPPKNTTGHPMLSAQNINGNIISKNTQSRPINPLNPPVQLPTSQGILHRSKSARVTKQSYHTAHKQPYSTQETQRLAQLHEAHAQAQERARQEQKQKEEYIFRHTRPREALHNGVHMLDTELDHVAFDMCQYFDSTDYRYGHLPSMNLDLPFPSIEDMDLTAVNEDDESASVLGPTLEDAPDLGDEPTGPENFIDLTNTDSERNEQEPTPLFNAPVPHDRFINAYELPAYNPTTASDSDFFTVGAGHETGTFLEPEWDEDEGCWRAPDTDVSQEGALVGELLQYAEEEKTSQSTDEASGWI